ncbi:VIT1/CCC1 transporter family protein [Flavobacterium sp.]|uniref:VIT1/CCC1 transporter family protein n=1 Tax=Flavobacterium sp. TaxID=239 RepID=UPI0032664092
MAKQIAIELTAQNALQTHARDELGTQANPLAANFASAVSFIMGGLLPLLVAIFAPIKENDSLPCQTHNKILLKSSLASLLK